MGIMIKEGRRDFCALLTGMCFFLAAVEFLLPKPLPFMRLGLANLPILLALDLLPLPWLFLLLSGKILGQSLLNGTLLSYAFPLSVAGSTASFFMMFFLKRVFPRFFSLGGISIAGALASNSAQLYLASILISGPATFFLSAPVYLIGLISSAFLGFFTQYFTEHSIWYKKIRESGAFPIEKAP